MRSVKTARNDSYFQIATIKLNSSFLPYLLTVDRSFRRLFIRKNPPVPSRISLLIAALSKSSLTSGAQAERASNINGQS